MGNRKKSLGRKGEKGRSGRRSGRGSGKLRGRAEEGRRAAPLKEGILRKNRRGFGFVVFDDGSEDAFVGPAHMGEAMDGDRVLVSLRKTRHKDSPSAVIKKVVERGTARVVGVYESVSDYGFVVPLEKSFGEDIFVAKEDAAGAEDGDLVVCRITEYPTKELGPAGVVEELIAREGEPGGDIRALIRQAGVPVLFSEEAQREAANWKERGILPEDLAGREDFRSKTVFTIDGADSKDFDDAVSCERLENGHFLLGVHIADVSHYVPEESALDREAFSRGNSIYLLDQVVPMLPEELSNDLCSLVPKEDRLTVSVSMEIDGEGKVVSHTIAPSVICSAERLVYEDVSDILEKEDETLKRRYESILKDLFLMKELYLVLDKVRRKRGSLDFDTRESKILLDEKGKAIEVLPAERRTANRLIEEFMVLANETVAEHFCREHVPFMYRVHEKPEEDAMREFDTFLKGLGYGLSGSGKNVTPLELQKLLLRMEGKPFAPIVHGVLLRAMQKAYYDPHCLGHFGLALTYYTHFTSPIRRYCDLFIHRIIKELSAGKTKEDLKPFSLKAAEGAEQASRTEIIAAELERDVEKMKKAEYIRAHVGESFSGIISGVTGFGIYVELENTVEGLVGISTLDDDYYIFEKEKHRLKGETGGKIYALGDPVRIRVTGADPRLREIDFILQ